MDKIKFIDIFNKDFKLDLKDINSYLNSINDSKEEISIRGIQKLIDFGKANFVDFDENSLSDGYHSFADLYEFRKMYNAALFNEWAKNGKYDVHKSKKHFDGEDCFGGGWFIVVAILPTGQISNHYKMKDWDLFKCEEIEKAKFKFDGHTPADVLNRIKDICLNH